MEGLRGQTPYVSLTHVSHNAKTGPIPVSSSSSETCPDSCPLQGNGCYGETGPISFHWKTVNRKERGKPWYLFLHEIMSLFPGTLWRHNQVGDLPHINQSIDEIKAVELTNANYRRKGFTFSHHEVLHSVHNQRVIKEMNGKGFAVNLSADTLEDADRKAALNIGPVVTILAKSPPWPSKTPGGRPILVCLNVTHKLTCAQCKLCQIVGRKSIIGFPAHGTRWKKAEEVFNR